MRALLDDETIDCQRAAEDDKYVRAGDVSARLLP